MTYAASVLRSYGVVRPAGEPSCSTGVPTPLALGGILAAGALAYFYSLSHVDEREKLAYAAGKRGAPRPALI